VQTFDDRAWTSRVVSGVDLLGVACVGNLEGWTVGRGGFIAHTTDGGTTWTEQRSTTTRTLHAVRFADTVHGAAVGDEGTLLVTDDGGATWRSIELGITNGLRGVVVAGSIVVAVGDEGVTVRSIDGGKTFTVSALEGAADLRAIASDPGAHLVMAVDSAGGIFASDGGAFRREFAAGVSLDAIALREDGAVALAVGEAGAVLIRDGLGAWQRASTPTSAHLHAALIEAGRAYVAGDDGVLLEATDFHSGWTPVMSQTRVTLWALEDL